MAQSSALSLRFDVRDSECDLQGIVNNAVYQAYLEHARHQFLKRYGMSFAQLTQRGIHLVVIRAEIDYKAPLRSGDQFIVESRLERLSPVRFQFVQDIKRQPDPMLILHAIIVCAAMTPAGRPIKPTALEPMFRACGLHDGAPSVPAKPSRK